jgi:hypothetical protein
MMCDGESLLIALASRTLYSLCIGSGVRTTGWPLSNAARRLVLPLDSHDNA